MRVTVRKEDKITTNTYVQSIKTCEYKSSIDKSDATNEYVMAQ